MDSTGSAFFAFKINRASSRVILCSRVNLSVNEPVVALLTPAATGERIELLHFAQQQKHTYEISKVLPDDLSV